MAIGIDLDLITSYCRGGAYACSALTAASRWRSNLASNAAGRKSRSTVSFTRPVSLAFSRLLGIIGNRTLGNEFRSPR